MWFWASPCRRPTPKARKRPTRPWPEPSGSILARGKPEIALSSFEQGRLRRSRFLVPGLRNAGASPTHVDGSRTNRPVFARGFTHAVGRDDGGARGLAQRARPLL